MMALYTNYFDRFCQTKWWQILIQYSQLRNVKINRTRKFDVTTAIHLRILTLYICTFYLQSFLFDVIVIDQYAITSVNNQIYTYSVRGTPKKKHRLNTVLSGMKHLLK